MEKSAIKIKEQLEFWLLKYYVKDRSEISGKELFTLFDLLENRLKDDLTKKLNLSSTDTSTHVLSTDFILLCALILT